MSDAEDWRLKRARAIQESIRQVLLHDWDPIHVQDEPQAQDEYDGYVGGVYGLLRRGASAEKIAEYLCRIQTEDMGMGGVPVSALIPVAEKLLALDIKLGSP